jgi:F420-non-reducing hydrogenase small subunit
LAKWRRRIVPDRPVVVFYSCGACEECEAGVLDFLREASDLRSLAEISWWPHYRKISKRALKKPAEEPILLAMISGPAVNQEQESIIRFLRRNSVSVVAYGSCANVGIPGLVNEFEAVLNTLRERPTGLDGATASELADILDSGRRTPDQIITVDHYLPGCPPNIGLLRQTVLAAVKGEMKGQGPVIAPASSLCSICPRVSTRPASAAREMPENWRDCSPDTCFLALGVDCMGPVVRGGCDAKCIEENRPCTGCFGPRSQTREQTEKIMGAFSEVLQFGQEADIEKFLKDVPDPIRSFYRYRLAASLLRSKQKGS